MGGCGHNCVGEEGSEWVWQEDSVSYTILETLIYHVECAIDIAYRFYSVKA